MPTRRGSLAALLLLAGCYPEERFKEDLVLATCDLYERCGLLEAVDYRDREECVQEMSAVQAEDDAPCDPYDPRAARLCIEALAARSCTTDSLESWPEACTEACPTR